jgi:aldehyde:ferredoxin oxidoreductase
MSIKAGFGWTGKILNIDLTRSIAWREELPTSLLESYLGGRGLAVRLMRDYFKLDPFDPQMPLIFACGPLCGTSAPASNQLSLVSRSPLTGTIFDCTAVGAFPLQLKGAGQDVLLISGSSPSPVFISIGRTKVEILPADDLWGSGVTTTRNALEKFGCVAAIGPAGENGVLFANVDFGFGNQSGRGGLGAVMGRKNLKAIVVNGDSEVGIADREQFKSACQDVSRLFDASQFLSGPLGLSQFGTALMVDLMSQRRMTPTENFRHTFFAAAERYSGAIVRSSCDAIPGSCCDCRIKCRMFGQDGRQLPEYDALSHFGALNGIGDLNCILESNRFCIEMGMDPVSAAATIAVWGEIRGRFATTEEMPGLLQDMALCSGDGKQLAQGSRRMAEQLGHPELSMTVKSLELPAYDPRGAYGLALSYCTSTCGGCDQQANAIAHEILRKPVPTDRFSFSGKARIVFISEDTIAAADSLAICRFALLAASLEEYAAILSAVTGVKFSAGRLAEIGRSICLTEHFYNCINGFSRLDDILPERFFSEPGSSGDGIEIPPIDRKAFEEQLCKYYRIRGLNQDGCFEDAGFLGELP